ncbi:MAG: histidine kinase, partial [Algoriphagus sp.]
EMRLQQAEGELKALKAQISPHFIFNSLNSIHHFIQNQNSQQAGVYLIKFSKLIRYVLESSSKKWVSLQEEIEANSTYLELEQVRRKHDFEFSIHWNEPDDSELIFIPPMLIQPFLENSIWHGIKKNGFIRVEIRRENFNHLNIQIEDDGKDITPKSEIDLSRFVKKSSMGLQLMKDRFNQLNNFPGIASSFEINKSQGSGTLVEIVIPFEAEA